MGSPQRDIFKVLGLLLGAGAVTLAVMVLFPHAAATVDGPKTALLLALKSSEEDGVHDTVLPGTPPLVSERLAFDRVTAELSPDSKSAKVVFTLDFTGNVGETTVSALGLEEVHVVEKDGRWTPTTGTWVPGLLQAVQLLVSRRQALEAGEISHLAALVVTPQRTVASDPVLARVLHLTDRHYEARAWFLRRERNEVLVSEDYHLAGTSPEKPVDEVGQVRLRLTSEDGKLLFADGLM